MAGDDGDRAAATADADDQDEDAPDAHHGPFLALLVLMEVAFLGWVLSVVVRSLLGGTAALDAYSVGHRVTAAAFLAVEMLIPLVVYVDLLRRPDDPDLEWVHATVMPVVNVLCAVAYFEERRRKLADGSDEPVDESA
ncbi:hypothetical protein HWV07_13585 [Natronomonas salina]|uniref:hypothetical protein n=1 Tax=Natronomonas salina TaxID=1710540 RepID=UPI0015B6355B|nr:hypothetical protein [Natronomonas salina]QLD90005.1 hypothetical protein HWV07_13585 [Natronomonas salina]